MLTFLYLGLSIPAKHKNIQCCSCNLPFGWTCGGESEEVKDVCVAGTAILDCVTV